MARRTWMGLTVFVAGSLAGALGACGGGDATPAASDDAGVDGSSGGSSGETPGDGSSGETVDSGEPEEEAPVSNPDQITCGNQECSGDAGACCATAAPGDAGATFVCQDEGATCAGAKIVCDESADCAGAEVCCMSVSGGPLSSACKESCSAQDVQLCKTDDDCGVDGSCDAYRCPHGRRVFACSKPASCN
jgi:hypothetical protein